MVNESSDNHHEKMDREQTIESNSGSGNKEQDIQLKKPYQKPVVSKYAQIEQITFS